MKRVCVIGNSHLAAIKLAWSTRERSIGNAFEFVFFGAHRDLLRNLHAEGTVISSRDEMTRRSLAMTSGLSDPALDLGKFDAIIIHAAVNPTWALRRTIALARHEAGNGLRISASLARDVCLVEFQRSILAHVLDLVRRNCDTPVLVTPQPLPSIAIVSDPETGIQYRHMSFLGSYSGPNLHEIFDEAVRREVAAAGATFVPQPASTIEEGYFTARDFSTGSIRLDERMDTAHPDNDHGHMNQAYGEILLDAILSNIEGATPRRSGD